MAKNYDYGFEISDSGGHETIRYRQDRLWFQSGCGWWVLFMLIGFIFMLMTEPTPQPGVKAEGISFGGVVFIGGPIAALAGMAYWRSRKREIVIDEKTMTVEGKSFDRTQILRVFALHKQQEYNYTHDPAYYDQQRREATTAIGSASATAGQLSTGVGLAAGEAILATRQKVQIEYGGKNIVIAKGLSIQRALLLVQAIAANLDFKGQPA